MTTLTGTYYKGRLKLDKPVNFSKPIKVTITFEKEKTSGLKLSDFSFLETQKMLNDCKTSFAEEVLKERRTAI